MAEEEAEECLGLYVDPVPVTQENELDQSEEGCGFT